MDTYYFLSVVAAVMVANAASFAFFMGAMKASKMQKTGVTDDELPWWVWVCLTVPPLIAAPGMMLLT